VLIPTGRRQKGRDQWRRLGFEEGKRKKGEKRTREWVMATAETSPLSIAKLRDQP
jgi:hypothetical protein